MGRLDVDDEFQNDLDDVDDFEGLEELKDIDGELVKMQPGFLPKTPRRRLEDRLDELRLKKMINDYDFDL